MHLLLSDVKMRFGVDLRAQRRQLRRAQCRAKQGISIHRLPMNRLDNEVFEVIQHISALRSLPAPPRRHRWQQQ